jgi:hypothetical protein
MMHALLSDLMYNSNNEGYSKQFKDKNMLNMADPPEGLDPMSMHSSNLTNNDQKDFVTRYVEGMEMVARYKKALDIIRGRE